MSRKRRRRVTREDRVKPPPEAAQHHRPWPMQVLLVAGPEGGGIDADEFEAALQIVETFRVLTHGLGIAALSGDFAKIPGNYAGSMSDRDAERCAIWFEWAMRLPVGLPSRLVAWIEDESPILAVEVLRRACRLWDRVRTDRRREPTVVALDRLPRMMLTMAGPRCDQNATARPGNLPSPHQIAHGMVTATFQPVCRSGGQIRASSNAVSPRDTSAPRFRRG
jgi:hypothetical protein